MRSRRTRRRYERVIPKPEVVIEDTPTPTASFERLEPSRARERRAYDATEELIEILNEDAPEVIEVEEAPE